MKRFLRYFTLCLSLVLCGCATVEIKQARVGVQDAGVERQIARANDMAARYKSKDFIGIETALNADLETIGSHDSYARQHILHELADIYSYQLLDLERAIEIDRQIISMGGTGSGSAYSLQHDAANQHLLHAKEYRDTYLNVPSDKVLEKSARRLAKNESLLRAEPARSSKTYSKEEMVQTLREVRDDIGRTFPRSADRYQLVSRLMRGEYELYRITKDRHAIAEGYKYLQNKEMKLTDIFYSEIDFLTLADYLDIAYRNSGEIRFAENALELTYKPYLRLSDTNYRWLYNKLVNNRINTLIDGYYSRKDYPRMLYYISLNKSRMILEDKVRAEAKKSNILAAGADFFNQQTGFPRFEVFQKKLVNAKNYLDFYMNGHYEAVDAKDHKRIAKATLESSGSFAGTRSIKLNSSGAADSPEVFATDSVYVSYISDGKVQVTRLDGAAYLHNMQERLDTLYDTVSDFDTATRGLKMASRSKHKEIFSSFDIAKELKLHLPESVTVSPDGWLSRYSFDWLLGRKTVRTLNLFTYGDTSRIKGLAVVGYFNPSINAPASPNNGDLPDAEKELDTLRPLLKNSTFYHGSEATIENLAKPIQRNILHLSMHGADNSEDPIYSKLLFSGSSINKDETTGRFYRKDDKKALYAKDMDRYPQLKDNDLVFTAACQTGLTKKSTTNQSEILGILRPLLINRNRNIILTLWPVESESAALFVKTFYSSLAGSNDVKSAFFKAQEKLKQQYGHPAFWAPYYLVQSE